MSNEGIGCRDHHQSCRDAPTTSKFKLTEAGYVNMAFCKSVVTCDIDGERLPLSPVATTTEGRSPDFRNFFRAQQSFRVPCLDQNPHVKGMKLREGVAILRRQVTREQSRTSLQLKSLMSVRVVQPEGNQRCHMSTRLWPN